MSTITAILEPEADGMLHLPVPDELKSGKVKVVATLEAAEMTDTPHGRIEISPVSGLPVWVPPPGSPKVTSEQVRALLADFP